METKLGGYHAIQKQTGNGGDAQTSPVDAFPKGQSPYGVFDMAGNTNDWLYDWYDPEYYSKSPVIDPNGPIRKLKRKKWSIPGGWASNLQRCIRGGGLDGCLRRAKPG